MLGKYFETHFKGIPNILQRARLSMPKCKSSVVQSVGAGQDEIAGDPTYLARDNILTKS